MPKQDGGYLMNDSRAAGGTLQEFKTVACSHCNAIVVLNPARTRPREYCRKCDHYVCDKPGCIVNCIPMGRIIDMAVRFPGLPYLLYGPSGEPLIGSEPLDKTKVY